MKAWHLNDTTGPEALEPVEIDEPQPGPGQVRVKLEMSGLNHLDLWVSRGLPKPHHLPHILGADGAGRVDAIGEGVSGFEIGDEIIIDPTISCGTCAHCVRDDIIYCADYKILGEHMDGTLTESVVIPTINAVRKPKDMDWDVAGTFGLATVTALRMLERVDLQQGERVLVVGIGGGVSTAAMSLALAFEAEVYVTSRSQKKIDWAIEQGATGGFLSDGEFGKEMAAVGGADVIIENVGPATLGQSLKAAVRGGRIAICGGTSGAKYELSLPYLFFKQLEIVGSSMGTHAQFARATRYVGSGEATGFVDRTFPFAELPEAMAYLDSGEQVGKVAISR
ncbi:MAG: alcohol dehydrogenase catalytic domain-containing protein [Acidimicrobiia bacterium]